MNIRTSNGVHLIVLKSIKKVRKKERKKKETKEEQKRQKKKERKKKRKKKRKKGKTNLDDVFKLSGFTQFSLGTNEF